MDDITPYIVEAVTPIREQLDERLEAQLSEADELAVASALALAALAGVRQALASVEFTIAKAQMALPAEQRGGLELVLHGDLEAEADLWGRRYESDADG